MEAIVDYFFLYNSTAFHCSQLRRSGRIVRFYSVVERLGVFHGDLTDHRYCRPLQNSLTLESVLKKTQNYVRCTLRSTEFSYCFYGRRSASNNLAWSNLSPAENCSEFIMPRSRTMITKTTSYTCIQLIKSSPSQFSPLSLLFPTLIFQLLYSQYNNNNNNFISIPNKTIIILLSYVYFVSLQTNILRGYNLLNGWSPCTIHL